MFRGCISSTGVVEISSHTKSTDYVVHLNSESLLFCPVLGTRTHCGSNFKMKTFVSKLELCSISLQDMGHTIYHLAHQFTQSYVLEKSVRS